MGCYVVCGIQVFYNSVLNYGFEDDIGDVCNIVYYFLDFYWFVKGVGRDGFILVKVINIEKVFGFQILFVYYLCIGLLI